MTGVELSIVRDEDPVPEYEIIAKRRVVRDMALWLLVPKATSEEDMYEIIHDIVNTKYSDWTYITFYIYDPETTRGRRPSTDEADQSFKWTLKNGIRRVE